VAKTKHPELDLPRITLEDFFEEVLARHLSAAIKWSGEELAQKPELGKKISHLLMSEPELTKIVLGISVQSQSPPPHDYTTFTTGIMIGISLALELLNEKEITDGRTFSHGSATIQ
jgi:hypothetical protein